MATAVLSRMLDDVKRLTPDERRQLREAIDRLPSSPPEPPTEEQFEHEMVESGILETVPSPASAGKPLPAEKLVDMVGKPLSETIIEDRG